MGLRCVLLLNNWIERNSQVFSNRVLSFSFLWEKITGQSSLLARSFGASHGLTLGDLSTSLYLLLLSMIFLVLSKKKVWTSLPHDCCPKFKSQLIQARICCTYDSASFIIRVSYLNSKFSLFTIYCATSSKEMVVRQNIWTILSLIEV